MTEREKKVGHAQPAGAIVEIDRRHVAAMGLPVDENDGQVRLRMEVREGSPVKLACRVSLGMFQLI